MAGDLLLSPLIRYLVLPYTRLVVCYETGKDQRVSYN